MKLAKMKQVYCCVNYATWIFYQNFLFPLKILEIEVKLNKFCFYAPSLQSFFIFSRDLYAPFLRLCDHFSILFWCSGLHILPKLSVILNLLSIYQRDRLFWYKHIDGFSTFLRYSICLPAIFIKLLWWPNPTRILSRIACKTSNKTEIVCQLSSSKKNIVILLIMEVTQSGTSLCLNIT